MSIMANNEEYEFYTDCLLDYYDEHANNIIKSLARSDFDSPKLIISRPIFDFEIGLGLAVHNKIKMKEKVKNPKETIFIDSLYRFKVYLDDRIKFFKIMGLKQSSSELLKYFVAYNFYDCLSSGIPIVLISLIRFIMENYSIDWDIEVYPGKSKYINRECKEKGLSPSLPKENVWYTLRDFYNNTQGTKKLEEYIRGIKEVGSEITHNILLEYSFKLLPKETFK